MQTNRVILAEKLYFFVLVGCRGNKRSRQGEGHQVKNVLMDSREAFKTIKFLIEHFSVQNFSHLAYNHFYVQKLL